MRVFITLFLGCLCGIIPKTQASIVVGGTRIIYPSNKVEVQIPLKNKDPRAHYLVQSWVSNPDDSKAPFIITPPVYKIAENRQTLLHVIYTGDKSALPADRESFFLANIKSISALPDELKDKNTLQFAMKIRLKLFWRPVGLNEADALRAGERVIFRREGSQLVAKNPTPYYISFADLRVDGKAVQPVTGKVLPGALSMMVSPFSEQRFSLPAGGGHSVAWSTINDYGAQTSRRSQAL